ncbi:hypothetical protein AB0O34_16350 [Sphaerisporangium sp. NPDC088356]|uniref:hypothetical protein n=1 Tax=Sphaerisporangium sp. NPDC088356 TaxID=3154871 RepID=UPI00342FBA3B
MSGALAPIKLVYVNARAALFDLYGDHLRIRAGKASVAALVRLLAPLDIAAPAVRTAISRMVRQDWLAPVRLPQGPGYALTPKSVRRLDETAVRVYRTGSAPWPGRWHVLVFQPVRERATRERLRADLSFLGYAPSPELLPPAWPGDEARAYFEQEAARLLPAAAAFVDHNLDKGVH